MCLQAQQQSETGIASQRLSGTASGTGSSVAITGANRHRHDMASIRPASSVMPGCAACRAKSGTSAPALPLHTLCLPRGASRCCILRAKAPPARSSAFQDDGGDGGSGRSRRAVGAAHTQVGHGAGAGLALTFGCVPAIGKTRTGDKLFNVLIGNTTTVSVPSPHQHAWRHDLRHDRHPERRGPRSRAGGTDAERLHDRHAWRRLAAGRCVG